MHRDSLDCVQHTTSLYIADISHYKKLSNDAECMCELLVTAAVAIADDDIETAVAAATLIIIVCGSQRKLLVQCYTVLATLSHEW